MIDVLSPGRAYEIAKMPTRREAGHLWAESGAGFTDRGQDHVTHTRGNRSETFLYFADDEARAQLLAARAAVLALTGWPQDRVGWHYARLARDVVKWLAIRQTPTNEAPALLPVWHYQCCRPAEFDSATMYDMTAAYWQIACRAKSPLLQIVDGRVLWCTISSEQQARWERCKAIVAQHKRLRLAVIGVNATGYVPPGRRRPGTTWYRGKMYTRPPYPTSLQPLAILTVRSAYELTQEQARETHTHYANADSVLVEGNSPPSLWADHGLQLHVKGSGAADVLAVGAYRVGEYSTKPYERLADVGACAGKRPTLYVEPRFHLQMIQ